MGRARRVSNGRSSLRHGGRRGVSWWSWKASLQNGIRCRECQLGIWPACPENTGFLGPLAGTNDAFAKVALNRGSEPK